MPRGSGGDAQVETLGVGEFVRLLVEVAHLRLALLLVVGGPAKFDCEARGGERSARGGSDEATAQKPLRRREIALGGRRPRSVPLTQADFGPASPGFTVALTTERGEGGMRSDVRFWEGRRDAPAARLRRGSVHLARYLISTTTRGDAATRGERRCYAPWTVIVPDNMTPLGGPRSR